MVVIIALKPSISIVWSSPPPCVLSLFFLVWSWSSFPPRPVSKWPPLDEDQVHSGDLFAIVRLDGLDPLLAWGMGSTNGKGGRRRRRQEISPLFFLLFIINIIITDLLESIRCRGMGILTLYIYIYISYGR